MRIGRRPSRCGSARKIGCQLPSYFSARSGPVSGTVSSRIRRDSKLDSAGIHGRARLTYDLSGKPRGWSSAGLCSLFLSDQTATFPLRSPRLVTASSRVCASFQNGREKRDRYSRPRGTRQFLNFLQCYCWQSFKFLSPFLGIIFRDFSQTFYNHLLIKLDLRHIRS